MKVRVWFARIAALGLALSALGALPSSALAVGSPTVTHLESSQNASPACSTVTFKATVFGAIFPDSPLGLVQFFDGGSTIGGPRVITPDFDDFLGAPVVPTNHSSATLSVALGGGTHIITVVYAGTDVPSTGGPLVQTVSAATSSTAVTSAVNPSVYGQAVPLTAAVTSSCAASVAGSVQFQVDGGNFGAPLTLDGTGHATLTTSALAVGTHPINAIFTSSNSAVTGSSGSLAGGQVVNAASTTTGVTSSANPSEFGAAVTFVSTTSVNAPAAGSPTGNVQFRDNGTNLGTSRALSGSGQASLTTSALAVGSHVISAQYTSDSANFTGSTGSTTQVVDKARTTLTYNGTTTEDYHDPAVLSATLTRTDNGTPVVGRTIDFGMGFESCSAVTDASGAAACSIIPTEPAGPFTVTATFSGDGNYVTSTDSRTFTVTKEETTTTYTGPTVIAQGYPLILAGRLLEDGTVPIVGRTLTLTIGSGAGSQSCVTAPTDASGNATCTVPSVSVGQGPQAVSAAFAGDAFYLPSSDTASAIIFAFPSRGIFVLGDRSASSSAVTFWGAQWPKQNALSGGAAPADFKGFAENLASSPPMCGGTWTTSPGSSSGPPNTVPAYMGTTVSSSVVKNGSRVSGNIVRIVVVATDPGFGPNAGHSGTGTVIATYC